MIKESYLFVLNIIISENKDKMTKHLRNIYGNNMAKEELNYN